MKSKLLFLIICIFTSIRCFSFAEDSAKKKINLIIKYDFVTIGLTSKFNLQEPNYQGTFYSGAIEKLFSKKNSIQYTFYLKKRGENKYLDKFYFHAVNYKYFVSKKKAYWGYYVGTGIKYLHTTNYGQIDWVPPQTINDPSIPLAVERNDHYIGSEFINGVQFYIFKRLTIDLLIGGGFIGKLNREIPNQGGYLKKDYPSYIYSKPFDARIAVNIGFKF